MKWIYIISLNLLLDMTNRLTKEFKSKVRDFMLHKTREIISTRFDKDDRRKETIRYIDETSDVTIYRSCFPDKTYFEDYMVDFVTVIDDKTVESRFFVEWKENNMDSELIFANNLFEPSTGKSLKRKIKIRLVKKCLT